MSLPGDPKVLVDRFLDAIWMERGLSENTLGAYRADLLALNQRLTSRSVELARASRADVLDYIAWRVESGAKPRSTARQLSSFRRFYRYLLREGLLERGSHRADRDAEDRPRSAAVADRRRGRVVARGSGRR